MRLDERPESLRKKERPKFEESKKLNYSNYSEPRHESTIRKVSIVCVVIAILGLIMAALNILILTNVIKSDWPNVELDVGASLNSNYVAFCIAATIILAVMALITFTVGILKLKQERKVTGVLMLIVTSVLITVAALCVMVANGTFHVDWTSLGTLHIGEWMNANKTAICITVAVLSAVFTVSALVAAVSGFKQENYVRGLCAFVALIVTSLWTIVIPILSIVLMINYIRSKDSFFC